MGSRARAARGSGGCRRAEASAGRRDADIVQQNWERGTLWASLALGVSFGLMLVAGAWLGW